MLLAFSFRSAFVFGIKSLILSGFPLTSFHLAEANLVPRAISKNWKPLFRLPLIAKRFIGVRVALEAHYLLLFFCLIFLCLQSSKNITKCFFSTNFAINLFYLHNLKT